MTLVFPRATGVSKSYTGITQDSDSPWEYIRLSLPLGNKMSGYVRESDVQKIYMMKPFLG